MDILKALEAQTKDSGLIELNSYLTSRLNDKQALYLHLLNAKPSGPDPITGLQSKTNYGRPNFKKLFTSWARRFPGKTVGVFYCGPKRLGNQLKWFCIKSSGGPDATQFKFHQETF